MSIIDGGLHAHQQAAESFLVGYYCLAYIISRNKDRITIMPKDCTALKSILPEYQTYPGLKLSKTPRAQ